MKGIKIIFMTIGFIAVLAISYAAGYATSFYSNLKGVLADANIYTHRNKAGECQKILKQLDNNNIDGVRKTITDLQDKSIISIGQFIYNDKTGKTKIEMNELMKEIAEHRIKYSNYYYPNNEVLIPANVYADSVLKRSINQ